MVQFIDRWGNNRRLPCRERTLWRSGLKRKATECVPYGIRPGKCYPGLSHAFFRDRNTAQVLDREEIGGMMKRTFAVLRFKLPYQPGRFPDGNGCHRSWCGFFAL